MQRHASETLRRSVVQDRVGHAYLFCGPRGVGKTTLARVLAMALNCPNRSADGEPCGSCDSCERIWSGTTALDVVEIDAASNRGVDDARSLRERAMYAPSDEGRSKVYIVDEAHMLTREAWNALLKVLEEPPPRVIFVFATTEPQKIEQTAAPILSRCQRFDFRRIGVAEIVERLRQVLHAEGVDAEEEALRLIARKAEGGMRDGLSVLEQVISFSDGELSAETVRRILGVVGDEHYLRLFGLIADRDRGAIFALVEGLVDDGYDLVEFYRGLGESLRSLLRYRVSSPGTGLPEDQRAEWEGVASRFEAPQLVQMLAMAADLETEGSLRRVGQPRVLLELLLMRFSYLENTVELEALLAALGGEAPVKSEGGGGGERVGATVGDAGSGGRPGPTSPDMDTDPRSTEHQDTNRQTGSEEADGGLDRDSTDTPGVGRSGVPAPESDPPAAPESRVDPAHVWSRLLSEENGLRPGMTTLLRSADVRADSDGLTLRVPPDLLLERLHEGEHGAVEAALERIAGRPIPVHVVEVESESKGEAGRVTPKRVEEDRLRDLLEKEPGLRPAVEELDLELME